MDSKKAQDSGMRGLASFSCLMDMREGKLIRLFVEPSGVQALKNPNPLKDVEALAVLSVAVLV